MVKQIRTNCILNIEEKKLSVCWRNVRENVPRPEVGTFNIFEKTNFQFYSSRLIEYKQVAWSSDLMLFKCTKHPPSYVLNKRRNKKYALIIIFSLKGRGGLNQF